MKRKRSLLLLLLLSIGSIGFFTFRIYAEKVKDQHNWVTQISSKLFDFNTFDLQVDSNLNKTDFKVINLNSQKVIFEKGKSQKGIKNTHGYCRFHLYYKNVLIYEFGHFKYNNWHTNHYQLILSSSKGKIIPLLKITGPDHEIKRLYFKSISNK